MTLSRRIFAVGLASAAGGCSPADLLNATVSHEGYVRDVDIAYGLLPRQKLDLYRPTAPRARAATVIFFHGGGWDRGNKSEYLFVAQALAARGTTVIVPDYRLYPEVRFPTFLEDSAEAVRWTADKVGVERLFLMGHSAGAHIALMLAANTAYLAAAGLDRMRLRAVIGLSGPYDFLPLTSWKLQDIFGGPNDPNIQAITFAKAPLPPALLIHGTADTTIYPRNSEHLAAAWRAAGAPVELKLYPDVGHIDVVAAFSDLLHARAPTREDVLAYIEAH